MSSTSDAQSSKSTTTTIARQRWRLLSRAVANYGQGKSVSLAELNSLTTVRQFCQFGLFNITQPLGDQSDRDEFVEQVWQHVDHSNIRLRLYLRQRLPTSACLSPLFTAKSTAGDGNNNSKNESSGNNNNTGNICVWPSEEVLAHYVIVQSRLGKLLPSEFSNVSNIRVCELGGGLTCLAGLAAGVVLGDRLSHLLLTDGDQLARENAARCLTANRNLLASGCDAKVAQLAWEDADSERTITDKSDRYHLVLCADCLFFRESHQSLLNTLDKLLILPTIDGKSCGGGLALICAPSRGRSVEDFARLAEAAGFDVKLSANYDSKVSQVAESVASFVPDLHLPLMLRLTKNYGVN